MKTALKITVIASFGTSWLLGGLALQAATPGVTLDKYTIEDIAVMSQPTWNPTPTIGREYVGLDLRLKLTINEKGQPELVRLEKPLISYSDINKMTFASQMRDFVTHWESAPAENLEGDPISLKVTMPVEVVVSAGIGRWG